MKKKLRVLVLVSKHLIPPDFIPPEELERSNCRTEYYVINTLRQLGHTVEPLGIDGDLKLVKDSIDQFRPHILFNLLEEWDGETLFDHNVVSYLELIKQAYTGCNPKGLLLARDKSLSKKILNYHRIKTPHFAVAKRGKKFNRPQKMQFPLIVKSLTEEGSVGISQNSVVKDDTKLQERIAFIHEHALSDAIVETFIEGKDIYISVLGNKKINIFPILQLEFKDAPNGIHQIATSKVKWNPEYREKYSIDCQFATDLSPELANRISDLSKKIYKILAISGYARLDMRLTDDGQVYFIEANPNPDISNHEEFAISAQKAGIDYPNLIEKIVTLGLNWNPVDSYN